MRKVFTHSKPFSILPNTFLADEDNGVLRWGVQGAVGESNDFALKKREK